MGKNTLEDLERGLLEYKIAGEFLADIKKEFREEDKESIKVAELRRLEEGSRTMKEFVQEFRRAARESGYERRLLVEEFKREISAIICWRLIESEWQHSSIEQWYNQAITLDQNWREQERRGKIEGKIGAGATGSITKPTKSI